MKYSELERKLKSIKCYATGEQLDGHPEWFSPKTGKFFKMSHHKSQEVKFGTLQRILKDSGLK